MSKFHINKHGVPAPCKATKGNCPYGGASGNENHYDTLEEAQVAADNENEQKHGFMPGMDSAPKRSKTELQETGKHLASLIPKRKSAVQDPDFEPEEFYDISSTDTIYDLTGRYVSTEEHDSAANAVLMFDHVSGKAGKLYRYDDYANPYLETYPYEFSRVMNELENELDYNDYFDPFYDEDTIAEHGKSSRELFKDDVKRHAKLHEYTEKLAIEYGKDYEKKVILSGDFDLEEQEVIREEYRRAIANRVGKYLSNYGTDEYGSKVEGDLYDAWRNGPDGDPVENWEERIRYL